MARIFSCWTISNLKQAMTRDRIFSYRPLFVNSRSPIYDLSCQKYLTARSYLISQVTQDLLSKQRKVKYLDQVKNNKYKMYCKTEDGIEKAKEREVHKHTPSQHTVTQRTVTLLRLVMIYHRAHENKTDQKLFFSSQCYARILKFAILRRALFVRFQFKHRPAIYLLESCLQRHIISIISHHDKLEVNAFFS